MTKYINDKRGFTFIELMMVVALLAIFLGIVYGYLNHNLTFLNQQNQEQQTYHQARTAMYRITNLLRQYERVLIEDKEIYESVQIEENGEINEVRQNKLLDFNENTMDLTDCKYYFYCADGKLGEIRDSAGNVVAKGIKTLEFKYEESDNELNDLIRITVTAAATNNSNGNEVVLTTIVRRDRSY